MIEDIPTRSTKPLTGGEINQGDDYEICFSANEKYLPEIEVIAEELMIPITVIGKMTRGSLVVVKDSQGVEVRIQDGYGHF